MLRPRGFWQCQAPTLFIIINLVFFFYIICLNIFSEDIYMTPKNNSPPDLKPEDIYVFDNEDVNNISEAPEHLEISLSAEIFMEILKLKRLRVILNSVLLFSLCNITMGIFNL